MVELKVVVEVFLAEDAAGDGVSGQKRLEVSGGVEASARAVDQTANSVAGTTKAASIHIIGIPRSG